MRVCIISDREWASMVMPRGPWHIFRGTPRDRWFKPTFPNHVEWLKMDKNGESKKGSSPDAFDWNVFENDVKKLVEAINHLTTRSKYGLIANHCLEVFEPEVKENGDRGELNR